MYMYHVKSVMESVTTERHWSKIQRQKHIWSVRYECQWSMWILWERAIDPKKDRDTSRCGTFYIKLGQPSTTLSGGEAQRVKLATELSRQSTGKTIYVLDEPTTGLHFADVHKLVDILQRLTEGGNTVVVIEHNLEVIKTADYIIDMGPEGGEGGGTMVTCGTPEEVAAVEESYTGKYLKNIWIWFAAGKVDELREINIGYFIPCGRLFGLQQIRINQILFRM